MWWRNYRTWVSNQKKGLEPKEEVLMNSGYRIDALVEVNGKQVGIYSSHFIGRSKSPLMDKIHYSQENSEEETSTVDWRFKVCLRAVLGVGQTSNLGAINEEARLSLGVVGTLRNFTTVGQNYLIKTKHEHRWNRLLKLHRLLVLITLDVTTIGSSWLRHLPNKKMLGEQAACILF
eukprot:scaffold12343_cov77-Skeletonema_dohrnii-CCMP3373.AAC.3